jgi:hypothetical protein
MPRLTIRRAAMDSPSTSRKKKQDLTADELALKKEEMARRRKNLSEKRAQDEQVIPSFPSPLAFH